MYVAGTNISGGKSIILYKYNSSGDILWSVSSSPDINLNDHVDIDLDPSGNLTLNYSVYASANTTFYTKRYNSAGSLLFTYQITGAGDGYSKIEIDGSGNTYILYLDEFVIAKINTAGTFLWSREFNPAGSNNASDLYVDGSSVFITGTQDNGSTANDFVTVKYNYAGTLQWSSFYNNADVTAGNSDMGISVSGGYNGSIIVAGESRTGGLYNRSVTKVVKYDQNGVQQWSAGSQFPGSRNVTGEVKSDITGNIYVLSREVSTPPGPPRTSSHVYKYDINGNLKWDAEGFSDYMDDPADLAVDNNLHVYTAGMAGNPLIGFHSTIVKFAQDESTGITNNTVPVSYGLMQNYPNPFNPSTEISFSIPKLSKVTLNVYDVSGKLVESLLNNVTYNTGTYSVNFNAADLTSGVYFYTLKADNLLIDTKKMMLVK